MAGLWLRHPPVPSSADKAPAAICSCSLSMPTVVTVAPATWPPLSRYRTGSSPRPFGVWGAVMPVRGAGSCKASGAMKGGEGKRGSLWHMQFGGEGVVSPAAPQRIIRKISRWFGWHRVVSSRGTTNIKVLSRCLRCLQSTCCFNSVFISFDGRDEKVCSCFYPLAGLYVFRGAEA